MEPDMKLPPGKTCGDCKWHKKCSGLFGCPATNTACDWSPSRFVDGGPITQKESDAILARYARDHE